MFMYTFSLARIWAQSSDSGSWSSIKREKNNKKKEEKTFEYTNDASLVDGDTTITSIPCHGDYQRICEPCNQGYIDEEE